MKDGSREEANQIISNVISFMAHDFKEKIKNLDWEEKVEKRDKLIDEILKKIHFKLEDKNIEFDETDQLTIIEYTRNDNLLSLI